MVYSNNGILHSNKKEQTADKCNKDESKNIDCCGKEARYKRVQTVRSFLYEVQEQAHLIYGDKSLKRH